MHTVNHSIQMTPKYSCLAFFTHDELVPQIIHMQFTEHIFVSMADSNVVESLLTTR